MENYNLHFEKLHQYQNSQVRKVLLSETQLKYVFV